MSDKHQLKLHPLTSRFAIDMVGDGLVFMELSSFPPNVKIWFRNRKSMNCSMSKKQRNRYRERFNGIFFDYRIEICLDICYSFDHILHSE